MGRHAWTVLAATALVGGGLATGSLAVRAAGLTLIPPARVESQRISRAASPHNIWLIGHNLQGGAATPIARAEIISVQVPGCCAGNPYSTAIIFEGGQGLVLANSQFVDEVASVDEDHYLLLSGLCYLSCTLRVYSVNLGQQAAARQMHVDRRPIKQAACGYTFTYRGQVYTVRATPNPKAPSGAATPHLLDGARTC